MSKREWDNASRIIQQDPNSIVITVIKGKVVPSGTLNTTNMPTGQIIIR